MEQPTLLTPINNTVFVEVVKAEVRKVGALEIPPSAETQRRGNEMLTGVVVAVGPGKYVPALEQRVPPRVSPGQRVLFGNQAVEVKIEGKVYLAMRDDNIAAVVE